MKEKSLINLYGLIILLFTSFCQNENINKKNSSSSGTSYEIYGRDTVNLTDSKGLKQGIWLEYRVTEKGREIKDTIIYKDGKIAE